MERTLYLLWAFAFRLILAKDACADITDLLQKGRCYFKANQHELAVAAYETAGESRPRALSDLGWHYYKGLGCDRDAKREAEAGAAASTEEEDEEEQGTMKRMPEEKGKPPPLPAAPAAPAPAAAAAEPPPPRAGDRR